MTYCTALPHQMDPLTNADLEDADLMLFGNPELPAFDDFDDDEWLHEQAVKNSH